MKLSVIIPVHNREKYIKRSVDSITACPWEDLEIILVDDGSTDNSAKVCQSLAATDSRIKYICQANSGVSVARNTGIDASSADYIMFCDDDDYYAPNWWEYLPNDNVSDFEFACFDYSRVDSNDVIYDTIKVCNSTSLTLEDLYKIYLTSYKVSGVQAKLFKSEFIKSNNLRFVKTKYAEDSLFIGSVIRKLSSFVYVDQAIYLYFNNPTSIINSNNLYITQKAESLQNKYNFILEKQDKLSLSLEEFFLPQYMDFITLFRRYASVSSYEEFESQMIDVMNIEAMRKMFEICAYGSGLRRKWQIKKILGGNYKVLYAEFKSENLLLKLKSGK